MRIATLANAAVVHTWRWVEYFRSRGHEVEVWSLERGPETLRAHSLGVPPLPGFVRYPLAAPALARALARFDPDLVDAHFVPNYGLLAVLVARHPLSVAAWGSDLLLARGAAQRARAGFVLRRADLILADAENLARAARVLGAPEQRVRCIPWGIDLERFRPTGARDSGLLLSTRRLEPIYDLKTLLAGVAPVLHRRVGTRLVIAGEGSQRRALESIAAATLPADRFQFVGTLDATSLAGWLARADLYLSASRSDSTSVSLLEAMASGAVPVVSDLEGNREWVQEGVGARLFRPGDPASLTQAVEAALDDPPWAERARAHNRSVAESRADGARGLARIESLFRSLVAEPRR
ncbi:MAG TPA: glycosyltransferase family 4 protein [Candidatus Eisenbacteria bacterium]|jgi:glycosyltransferase involved in cell wall biosynthesis